VSSIAQPKVSVIIPAYRAAATIGRAVDSVLSQTCSPHEILVIDDGSPDDLPAALSPYGESVRLVRQANGGAASARNHGIERACGDLIAFLDADDYWEPQKLERQLEVLKRHPEVGLVTSCFYIELLERPRYPCDRPVVSMDVVLQAGGPEILTVARSIWTSALLVRRDILGDQRFDTTLVTAEDVDLWVRLVRSTRVYLISQPLATAVLVAGSLSRSNVAGDARNMLTVIHRYSGDLGRAGVRAWESQVYREWAAAHLGNGEPQQAVRPAWERLCRQPWSARSWWILCKAAAWACDIRFRRRGSHMLPS
jgi:glycosyltransferase involved in cell wall biosynthesis